MNLRHASTSSSHPLSVCSDQEGSRLNQLDGKSHMEAETVAPNIRTRRALGFLAVGAAVLLLGPSVVTLQAADPEGQAVQAVPELKFDGTPLPVGTPTYAPIVEKVSPSVVTINTSQTTKRGEGPNA
ncbi:MAG: hypothetical protein WCK17_16375, partial [Verrucomicrobiota bacterium]